METTTIELSSSSGSVLTRNQKIKTGWKMIADDLRMRVTIRYDDEYRNGHNTFSITGDIEQRNRAGRWVDYAGGCLHDEIAAHYPEYRHLIKWHLTSSDGPMHYLANTLHHASDRDCWGKAKGEVASWKLSLKFENFPIVFKDLSEKFLRWLHSLDKSTLADLEIISIPHDRDPATFKPKYTFGGYADKWYECPFDSEAEALQYHQALSNLNWELLQTPTSYSEGKERDLDAARSCAVWPDATDEELLSENLKERLIERLPRLLAEFRRDIEALGFVY